MKTALPQLQEALAIEEMRRLLPKRPHDERSIEVKGRVGTGEIELTENEWARACNLRDRY